MSRQLENTFVANLADAASRCADNGIKLLIEPINLRDIPGFFVSTTKHAERILERVGHDNLYIQYDIYHMQVMQGDLVPTYARLRDRIAHVQVADNPGPQRARDRRDQLPLSSSPSSTGSATMAMWAASTSRRPERAKALRG